MLLTEYNEADAKELFKKEGFREGFLEACMSVGEVINYLWQHGRGDDAIKAENDKDYSLNCMKNIKVPAK